MTSPLDNCRPFPTMDKYVSREDSVIITRTFLSRDTDCAELAAFIFSQKTHYHLDLSFFLFPIPLSPTRLLFKFKIFKKYS